MKKTLALVMVLCMALFALSACGGAASSSAAASTAAPAASSTAAPAESGSTAGGGGASGLRAAAIFGGAINDGNWNETQYNGLKNMEKMGYEIAYMENVDDASAPEMARTYADEGYDLVFLTTNSYQDPCIPVAESFPDTMFIQINGTHLAPNFLSVRIADEEQGFLQGVIAALLSESGKVGFVGGMEINPIKLGSSGFQQGVDYANQEYGLNVTAQRINTGSFTDVNQAKETAISIIESGSDVIAPMANDASVGVLEAAEEKGIMAVGVGLGNENNAPTTLQVTVVKDVAVAYDVVGAAFADGTLKIPDAVETYGANYDVVYVTDWFVAPSDDVKTKVDDVLQKMKAGEIVIDTTI